MMTIDEFETLALSQKPADKPWTPVLSYDFETRREVEGRQPKLIKDVFQPVDVLDYGCGAGYLVALLCELGVDATGYDPSEQLRHLVPPYIQYRVRNFYWDNRMNNCSAKGIWDLVICREVLEHLTILEIKKAVREICYGAKRFVYVTTRFSSEHDILSVDTHDDLDPTHITLPSKDLLRLLFVLEGFKRRADLEEKMDWLGKHRVLVYERAA